MKTKSLISVLFLYILLLNSVNAFDIGLFPARQGVKGWHIETTIQLYNNISENITFKIYASNPVKHTKYNETGIYDTLTDGENMMEYENLPNLSWVKLPDTVTVLAKNNNSSYTIKYVPVIVDIPKNIEYAGKHYEVLICAEHIGNQTIHISLASRLLIDTPKDLTDSEKIIIDNYGYLIIIIIIFIFTILIIRRRYKK